MEQHTKNTLQPSKIGKLKKTSELVVSNDFIASSEEVFKNDEWRN